jgi:uncharacterized protein (DUF1778 family)
MFLACAVQNVLTLCARWRRWGRGIAKGRDATNTEIDKMSQYAVAPNCPAEPRIRRDTNINLRIPHQTRELIDAAAAAVGQTRTEFVVTSAKQHAIDVLLDQRFFNLNTKDSASFLDILRSPPEPNEKLRELMKRKTPWME